MVTYFITGGEGFIGYHLCKELLEDKNNKVITYDINKHFFSANESNWYYYQDYKAKELNNDRLVKVRGDVNDRGRLRGVLENNKGLEVIINLAGLPVANISHIYPKEAMDDIFNATVTLIDVVKDLSYKVNRVVNISSSMVYGDFRRTENGYIIPAREDQACNPKGIYDAMKLCSEILIKTYNKRFGIPYTIIRPSAVYGPTDCNLRVTELFVMNSLLGKELILDNGGLHQLDFTYVKDTAHGIILAATSDKALGETFNITMGNGRTIKELAELLIKMNPDTGSKAVVKGVDVYRPNRGTLDISKARRLLGYEPKYSLESGMEEYVDFVKNTIIKDKQYKK